MAVCVRDGRDFSAEASFVVVLEGILNVKLSDSQQTSVIVALAEFEELKFSQTGLRLTKDKRALPGGGC